MKLVLFVCTDLQFNKLCALYELFIHKLLENEKTSERAPCSHKKGADKTQFTTGGELNSGIA